MEGRAGIGMAFMGQGRATAELPRVPDDDENHKKGGDRVLFKAGGVETPASAPLPGRSSKQLAELWSPIWVRSAFKLAGGFRDRCWVREARGLISASQALGINRSAQS